MSFSSRRRNYLLTPHRRDGLIEWMKSMLTHSFVLDALESTGADTFSHFEILIEEHRKFSDDSRPSRLQQLVPTVGSFHTHLPLRQAFEVYNEKHQLTKRKHIQISFNEIRHILNLAQVMALRTPNKDEDESQFFVQRLAHGSSTDGSVFDAADDDTDEHFELSGQLNGAKLMTFDGDQTLYSDGSNFEGNPLLANYLTLLLKHGVNVAIVTAAGYEYNVEKYELRLSGLLKFFKSMGLTPEECHRFYLFGGECNYLLQLRSDFKLHPVPETGAGGWMVTTKYLTEAPGNWNDEEVNSLLDLVEDTVNECLVDQRLRGKVIRKKRAVGLVPIPNQLIPREGLDETVLRCQSKLQSMNDGHGPNLPFCAFNGGNDAWVDIGNKRVGVQILQSYLGIGATETLHIGDQFLNTGNDYAARDVCPCVWITSPDETTYILKVILRLSGIPTVLVTSEALDCKVDFEEIDRRNAAVKTMDVYTGEITTSK